MKITGLNTRIQRDESNMGIKGVDQKGIRINVFILYENVGKEGLFNLLKAVVPLEEQFQESNLHSLRENS